MASTEVERAWLRDNGFYELHQSGVWKRDAPHMVIYSCLGTESRLWYSTYFEAGADSPAQLIAHIRIALRREVADWDAF